MRWTSPQLPAVERRPLILKASEFQHLFEEGPTEKVYANTPVSGLSQAQQGKMVEVWARKVLQKKNPETKIADSDRGTCCNGSRRGLNMAAYDFLMGGRRVEIKSSRMVWDSRRRSWNVQFCRVKLPFGEPTVSVFDDLYLVILSPKCLYLIKHDLVTGVSTRGNLTEVDGHMITICGSRRTDCWEDSLRRQSWRRCASEAVALWLKKSHSAK